MIRFLEDKKIIGGFVLLIVLILTVIFIEGRPKEEIAEEIEIEEEEIFVPEPTLQIIDEESDSRVLAIMINNHPITVPHHAGLQDAFVIYEVIVEGGFTRLLALYRDAETARIGSVRSARHYYLDYALEYDAVFVHFGGSPQAYNDIRNLGVNAWDFMARKGSFRDRSLGVAQEHTAYTDINSIMEELQKANMRLTSDNSLLNYSIEEIFLTGDEALEVKIEYSRSTKAEYVYNDGYYYRSFNGKKHVDAVSKKQYGFKNLIIKQKRNYSLGDKGRQELDTVGTGEGYFITNGVVQEINWSKASRSAKTVYTYKDGSPVVFNDGNTFIHIVPLSGNISIIGSIDEEV